MRKVLITGIAGFAGSHLAERLHGRFRLWGVHLDGNLENISGISEVGLIRCDLLDGKKVLEAIGEVRPDFIFHLAAQSVPSLSFSAPAETLRTNIFATLNILEAVWSASPSTVVLAAGSGDAYGAAEGDSALDETAALKPLNPYAVSKATADMLAYQYWKAKGVKTIRLRPFNHFGPRQAASFVVSAFAKQIAEIEAGIKKEKSLKTGNLDSARDFLSVKDVAAAYELLMEKGVCGEAYNICSGRAVRIRWILDTLLSFSAERILVEQDATRLRPNDPPVIRGDASKLGSLGWAPCRSLEDGLKAVLEFWRERVGKGL